MAVACGASVSQMVSVPRTPLSGSRPETLRSCPQLASVFGATNGSRVVAMATKKAITSAPKKALGTAQKNFGSAQKSFGSAQKSFGSAQKSFGSVQKKFGSTFGKKDTGGKLSWLPGIKIGSLTDPEWLDGSLPGDYGFDPLGLGKDPSALKWYREAEIIHGRWAMAAVIGIFVGQAWSGVPWYEAGAEPGAVAPFSFGTLLGTQLLLMGWVETKRWIDFLEPGSQLVDWSTPWSRTAENFGNATGLQGYPGGKFFDPLALGGDVKNGKYITDYNKLSRLQLAEIKHARIAMLALLTFYFEAGQGLTPLGALGQ